MAQGNWLTLMEYSNRYRVSISTLRRKIKSGDLTHQFVDGKYYLLDDSLPTQKQASGPETIVPPTSSASQDQEPQAHFTSKPHVCETAENLLAEVKRAYSMILQEKEEQILQLREEVSDLQTLVRVLENEVHRLNKMQSQSRPQAPQAPKVITSNLDSELNLELDHF